MVACDEKESLGKATKGFIINEPEKRAIHLSQLRTLLAHIRRRCPSEHWVGVGPDDVLNSETLTLYDAMAYVIKPATRARKCSYVEFVASGEQIPSWFVAHYWGASVAEFCLCLEQHARDRSVDLNTTGYWASGYALSQWNVEDLSRDPLQSCFAKAMRLSDGGAVTIVDKSAACFDRTWVLYEQYLICTVRDERRDTATPFKWDLYTACHHKLAGELTVSADDGTANKFTAGVRSGTTTVLANMSHNKSSPAFFHNREAVGLTDGIGSGTDRDLHSKALREKHFPQALLTTALTKRVRNGAATSAQDHARLLNSLAGAADLNAAPAKTHNGYNMADALVHGSLAVNCLVHGINTMPSPLFPAVLEGMRGNTSTREFTFPFEAEGVNVMTLIREGCWEQVLDALPTSITNLHMSMPKQLRGIPAGKLTKLKSLTSLDLSGSVSLTSLPEDVCMLSEIAAIDCNGCKKLATIPSKVYDLQKLKSLVLSGCSSLKILDAKGVLPSPLQDQPGIWTSIPPHRHRYIPRR